MMKVSRIFILACVFMLVHIVASASDSCDMEMVASWKNQRDETVVMLIRLWLRKASREQINREILSFTRNEMFLSHCCPPLDPDELYIPHLKRVKEEVIPIEVLMLYLKRCGFDLHAGNFFKGKAFRLIKK